MQNLLIGEMIGLARATDGNEHLINPSATAAILHGLRISTCLEDPSGLDAAVERILVEKKKMIPDCFACASPCGKNNAFDLKNLDSEADDIARIKKCVILELQQFACRLNGMEISSRSESLIYQALTAIGIRGVSEQDLHYLAVEISKIK